MKVSLEWIQEYVDIPAGLTVSELARGLTLSTVEVEGTVSLGQGLENIVVGLVREILPHPNADKLLICRADVGGGQVCQVVCGGSNLWAGMKAAVALPGALVRWHGEGEPVVMKKTKVRGEESEGMICASSEIGLFDLFPFTEEATIVDLSGLEAQAGTPLAQALGLDDHILEIDNKSLTNRPDLWGHYGIAREIAALYGLELKPFPAGRPLTAEGLNIRLEDRRGCPRYIGVRMEGLSAEPSPYAVRSRLWRVGMRPINAIVDITNYVMLATGQPTHAFDADLIKGGIAVRRAREGERLLLLSGKEAALSPEDLVIADGEGPVALAGVMGGEKDSILPDTARVILEIASFEALGVRRTAARHEARTEAATRYEKGIDPERADLALALAMGLFAERFPGMEVSGFRDEYPEPAPGKRIAVSLDWLEKRLGKRFPNGQIADRLSCLGFGVSFGGDGMELSVPSWRSTGDVSIPDDIVEEIARMVGFESFEEAPVLTAFGSAIRQPEIELDRRIREYLAFRCGMQEVYTYPWIGEAYAEAVPADGGAMLALSTPPSPKERLLRSSLLPNLCRAVAENLRYFNEFALFESAQVFFDRDYAAPWDPRESLPSQRKHAAGAFAGDPAGFEGLFRRAKGLLEALPRYGHAEPFAFEQAEKPAWADGVVWLNILHCGKNIGSLGLLAKKAAMDCGIKNSAVMLFELDIDAMRPYPSRTNRFAPIPEYPMADYDISMLFDRAVKWEEIRDAIGGRKGPDDLLRDVTFVGEYRGRQVPEGKKSVTFRLLIGSARKTLTSDEIEQFAAAVMKRLRKAFGAELRG